MLIKVYEIIQSEFCVAPDDGKKLYTEIESRINQKEMVEVSFENIEVMTSSFLNYAIGKLFVVYDEKNIKPYLKFSRKGMKSMYKQLLVRVINTAKLFKTNPELFNVNEVE